MAGRRRGGYKAYAVKYLQGSSWYTAGGKGTKMPSEMADLVVEILRKKGKTVKKVFDRPVNKFRSFRKKPKSRTPGRISSASSPTGSKGECSRTPNPGASAWSMTRGIPTGGGSNGQEVAEVGEVQPLFEAHLPEEVQVHR